MVSQAKAKFSVRGAGRVTKKATSKFNYEDITTHIVPHTRMRGLALLTLAVVLAACADSVAAAVRPIPLPGPLRPFGYLLGGLTIGSGFFEDFACDPERSENNKRIKVLGPQPRHDHDHRCHLRQCRHLFLVFRLQMCRIQLREARAEVKRAHKHLEVARDTRDIYLKEVPDHGLP